MMGIAENEKTWIALNDEGAFGPVSAVEIKRALLAGDLKDDDSVLKKSWSSWKQLKTIPLFDYECKKSIGSGKPLTSTPIPSNEEFNSIISPKVSTSELKDNGSNWNLKRITIVTGSTMLGGIVGGVLATGITMKGSKQMQDEKDQKNKYIDPKNQ